MYMCIYCIFMCIYIYIYPKHSNIGSPIAMISTENSGNIGWEYLEKKTVCFHKQLSIAKRGTYHKVGPLSSKLVQLQWTYICTNPSVEISTIKPAVSVVTKELLPILGKSPTGWNWVPVKYLHMENLGATMASTWFGSPLASLPDFATSPCILLQLRANPAGSCR